MRCGRNTVGSDSESSAGGWLVKACFFLKSHYFHVFCACFSRSEVRGTLGSWSWAISAIGLLLVFRPKTGTNGGVLEICNEVFTEEGLEVVEDSGL